MRYLVNVNTNHSTIKVHKEDNQSCSEIFKQMIAEYATHNEDIIQVGDNKDILKLGITDNSFWLLIHESVDSSKESIKSILSNNLNLTKDFSFVKHC